MPVAVPRRVGGLPAPVVFVRGQEPHHLQAAVKGGRRPAERTLEGCVADSSSTSTMDVAGRPAAGLDAISAPCVLEAPCSGSFTEEAPKAPNARPRRRRSRRPRGRAA